MSGVDESFYSRLWGPAENSAVSKEPRSGVAAGQLHAGQAGGVNGDDGEGQPGVGVGVAAGCWCCSVFQSGVP